MTSMEKELGLADIYDYQIFSEDRNLEKLFADAEAIIKQEQNV